MVQEITTQSWGSRIVGAFFGILFGTLLIIGSFILVFWNEGHGLHTAQSLQQAQLVLMTVPNSPINAQNNLHVVYFNGIATTDETLTDNVLNIKDKAINLKRKVQMYQWKEKTETTTDKEFGGSEKTTKTYSYQMVWADHLIDSSKFKEAINHQNPQSMPIESKETYAKKVTVGDFILPSDLIEKISGSQSVSLSATDADALQEKLNKPVQHDSEALFVGKDAQFPAIGDMKITLTEVLPQTVSVIAQQTGNTVQAYIAPAGEGVMLLAMGSQTPQKMILDAQSDNELIMWILRAVTFVMMFIGIALLLKPLVVIADVIPFFGSIINFGTTLIAFVIGFLLWSIATAIAWFTVRPLFAMGLIIIAAALIYLAFSYKRNKKPTLP